MRTRYRPFPPVLAVLFVAIHASAFADDENADAAQHVSKIRPLLAEVEKAANIWRTSCTPSRAKAATW
jgi:hypothetical protein